MGLTYFKRYRMELDLTGPLFAAPALPPGYRLAAWNDSLLEAHGDVKYRSFRQEVDAHVFPCFTERDSCIRLMSDIAQRDGFLPQATWLAVFQPRDQCEPEYCGTIQGVQDGATWGAVQNVGITAAHRGLGIGTLLMHRALDGFRRAGLSRCYLEVTAQNTGAVRLYRRLGFRRMRTVYKAAEVAYV